ncbi:MAG: Uncharacterized protein G01um10147_1011 [Microgenomates group bacterium Gr01-1014_7]|nr:MAG: Uncharacterized protein G01um10147_1011 [Microgenomates group bacterium Gr01-1014_7]
MDKLNHQFRVGLVAAWFGASLTCLLFAILFSFYLSTPKVVLPVSQSFKLYAAIPTSKVQVSENFTLADARPKLIENLFEKHKSPLADLGALFVTVADKYGLDYKLLPSIAMQESKGGQKVVDNSHNPFGYGIYGDLVLKFSSWEEAIERVGRGLKMDYLDQGLKTPQQIMPKYTPPSLAKGGTWAKGVSYFMEELR